MANGIYTCKKRREQQWSVNEAKFQLINVAYVFHLVKLKNYIYIDKTYQFILEANEISEYFT